MPPGWCYRQNNRFPAQRHWKYLQPERIDEIMIDELLALFFSGVPCGSLRVSVLGVPGKPVLACWGEYLRGEIWFCNLPRSYLKLRRTRKMPRSD